ncbi:type II secretion system F family protein [Modestobacter italicus]|uniref:type II secretion system F family protein n=1 Tax=Modestobacter italicus (strain DSM 44449 / CECT 9708 / BC 501) TaxID=2732864 RepID=UPI001C95C060|nr:pilus assembly protein TadB [Modestobacter italicus]
MSPALLCLALGLLAWPSGARPGRLAPRRGAGAGRTPGAVLAGRGRVLVPAVAAVVAGALVSTPVVAALAGVCAGSVGRAVQARRRAAAEQRRTRALVEALGVLTAEVRAGRSLAEATGAAVDGCPDPATATALGPVLRLGDPPPDGTDGGDAAALARIAAAVRLSAHTGCSLAGVLTAVEDDLRARLRAEEELRSAVAGPRASAAVLAGLPVLGLLMGSGVGADPWRVLTTTAPGTALLVVGVGLELAGTAWSAHLVRRAVQR